MTGARALLAALVLVGVGVALTALAGHDAALDRDRALLVAQTERFGPGTRGRIAAWAEAHRPGAALRWSAGDPAIFDDAVPLTLHIGDAGPYRFMVSPTDRAVRALDDETRGLVRRIAQWAAEAQAAPVPSK